MSQRREAGLYTALIAGFLALTAGVMRAGPRLETVGVRAAAPSNSTAWTDFSAALHHGWQSPLALLLAQIVAILLAARGGGLPML